MLKYGTLWLCLLISTNGQGAVKRFHCFNVKFSIDKTSNTMSLELRKYAIFYPLLFRTGNNILYLHEIKHVLSVTPHFRNKEFKGLSELFRHGVHEWQVVIHQSSVHLWWFCDDSQSSFCVLEVYQNNDLLRCGSKAWLQPTCKLYGKRNLWRDRQSKSRYIDRQWTRPYREIDLLLLTTFSTH